jgi:hypothetical protein
MNEVLNDINKLQKITDRISKNIAWDLNVVSVLDELRNMIKEKEKIVKDFEKQAPNHIQDLCNQIKGAR